LTINKELGIKTIDEEVKVFYKHIYTILENYEKPLIKGLQIIPSLLRNPRRRLKKKWCRYILV